MTRYGDNGGGGFDPDGVIDIGRRAGGMAKKHFRLLAIGLIVLVGLVTSYYQVESDEVGVVTRFGRYTRTEDPGLHFKVPFWIESAQVLPVQRQLKEEFGFRTVKAGVRTEYADDRAYLNESLMLTGDLNVATVEWIVQYKIKDPYQYLFHVREPQETFRDMAEATMRQVVGDASVTEVISIGRAKIQVDAKQALQELCDRYGIGIEVVQLVLKDVNPPETVKDAFNDVSRAQQERESAINKAEAEYNRVIPEARGKALRAIQVAEGYSLARINRAKGEVARFAALQKEYAKAPRVTRTRIYLETMAKVLPNAGRRILLDANLKGVLPLLPLKDGAQ